MIKVITTEEVEQMHYLLKYYHPYVVEQHGKTLLPQFLGKYTVLGLHSGLNISRPENLKKSRQKNSSNQINEKIIFCAIAFLAVLNFFPVQKLIFGHF